MLNWVKLVVGGVVNAQVFRFGLVGLSGIAVNNVFLYLLHGVMGWPLLLASPLAIEAAIINNYIWNDRWTFAHRRKRRLRFVGFNLVSIGGLVVNAGVLNLLVEATAMHYLVANLIGIAAAFAWNFTANAHWTWGEVPVAESDSRDDIQV